MRRLIGLAAGLAAKLYPPEWRTRYGEEFQCLLEDASPRWRDLFDVIKGGIEMRLTGTSMTRTVILWALIGTLPALWISLRVQDRYIADTTVLVMVAGSKTPVSAEQMSGIANRSIGDEKLARLIEAYGLYYNGYSPRGLTAITRAVLHWPGNPASMGEAVDEMKRNIRIGKGPKDSLYVSFNSSNPVVAAQVTNQLAAVILKDVMEENLANPGREPLRFTILDPARIPTRPFFPNRSLIMVDGVVAGAILGLIFAWIRRRPLQLPG